jgi:hypothetical protein
VTAPAAHRTRGVVWLLVVEVLVVGVLVVGVLVATVVPAVARTGGAIEGTVVHGTDGTVVAGLDVALEETVEGELTVLMRTTTDTDGRFAFADVAHGTDLEVTLTYDGATYRHGPVLVAPDTTTDLEVEVFESTDDPAEVVVASWVVWVDHVDGISIQQDLQVDNRGRTTFLGTDPDAAGVRAVIAVPMHPDAVGLRFLGRFTGCCATLRDTDYVHTTPLPPGPSSGTLRYAVGSLETLTLPARLPVESFTMMVPAGVTVGTDRLELSGEIESQGNRYDVYTTEGLAAGDVVEVRLRGLAVPAVATWQLAFAAVAALAGAGAAAVWWRRRHRSPARAPRETDRSPIPDGRAGRTPVAELDAELLVDEIALLDVGYAEGRLAREPYERLRAVRKAELLALASAEEDGPWS